MSEYPAEVGPRQKQHPQMVRVHGLDGAWFWELLTPEGIPIRGSAGFTSEPEAIADAAHRFPKLVIRLDGS